MNTVVSINIIININVIMNKHKTVRVMHLSEKDGCNRISDQIKSNQIRSDQIRSARKRMMNGD